MFTRRPAAVRRPLRSRTGLTLIELLTVVAIIIILASMLIPAARNTIESGRSTRCKNNLKQWGTAVMLYVQENDGRLPSAQTTSGAHTPRSKAWYDYGVLDLKYSSKTLLCPSQGPTNMRLLNGNPVTVVDSGNWPITGGTIGEYKNGYTCNSFWIDRDDVWQPDYRGYRYTMLPKPSAALMFGDGDGSAYSSGEPSNNFRYRHGPNSEFINVTMFDGRVEQWSIYEARTNGPRYLAGAPMGDCPGTCTNAPLFKLNKLAMPPYS